MPADPKGAPRQVASRQEWEGIHRRKSGPCRGCGRRWDHRSSLHHLVPRSLGGDDVADNIIPLCGSGTTGCHGLYEERGPGWELVAGNIRRSLLVEERRHVVDRKGIVFLDRYYPKEA